MFSVTMTSKSAGVDQHVRQRNVGKFLRHHANGHLAPQARRLQHVGLVDGAEPLSAATRDARRRTDDPLDLGDGVRAAVGGAIVVAHLVAEVDAARQLAHDEHVDAGQPFRTQRRRVEQLGIDRHRAQVGVEAQAFADREQALLGADLGARVVPLRAAHRAQQHGVGLLRDRQRLGRQRRPGLVDRRAADQRFAQRESVSPSLTDRRQHTRRLRDHFGTDSIPRQNGNSSTHNFFE